MMRMKDKELFIIEVQDENYLTKEEIINFLNKEYKKIKNNISIEAKSKGATIYLSEVKYNIDMDYIIVSDTDIKTDYINKENIRKRKVYRL